MYQLCLQHTKNIIVQLKYCTIEIYYIIKILHIRKFIAQHLHKK